MTLRERNLVLTCLRSLKLYDQAYGRNRAHEETIEHAIEIMTRQPIQGPGLPVSAGGDPEMASL